MKTVTLISLYIAAVSWPAYADSQEEEFTVHLNSNSLDINKYVRELAGKLYKDLHDNPSLKLNQTAINDIHDRMYVAVVVDKSSASNYLVKVIDIKPKNKETDNSSSDSESDEDWLQWP